MGMELSELGRKQRCDSLILLGDVKDELLGVSPWGMAMLTQFFAQVSSSFSQVILVPGNHDGGIEGHLPSSIKLASPHGIMIGSTINDEDEGKVALLHGHAEPSPNLSGAKTLVMGHRHFILRFGRNPQPLWIRGRIGPKKDKNLVIVPPFNHLLPGAAAFGKEDDGGSNSYVSRVVRENFDTLEALLLDGTNLGTLKSLKDSLSAVDD